ncbi:MAG: Pleiotropic regulatory protein [Bryobacterales bacterium]|nr:Pleiotropic regulatory protein [Bryobacterales bacterium]
MIASGQPFHAVNSGKIRALHMPSALTHIPLLDVCRQTAAIRPQLDRAIAAVLDHGQFINGPEVKALEERIAAFCGVSHAIACANGSDAILLTLMALGVGHGHKVITTPFTFFATAGSIARLGAEPLFVDIDPVTFNIDPAAIAACLEGLSPADRASVRAILPVHLFGQCADMDAINTIAARHGIPVIEDAAQAIGAEYKGRRAGALALCACFSFFPSKNLGGMGDGGMITTNDAALAAKLRILREHGSEARYYHAVVGINSRLDTLQAAILLVKMDYLEEWTQARQHHAAIYNQALSRPPVAGHVYNQYTVTAEGRDHLKQRLADAGVSTAIYYPVPLHLQQCFASLGYRPGDLPHSEKAAATVLSLPVEHSLTDEEIKTVASLL